MICLWCNEPITPSEPSHPIIEGHHLECGIRVVTGPLAHLQARCSCFIAGSTEADPPEQTRRQSAAAVLQWIRLRDSVIPTPIH